PPRLGRLLLEGSARGVVGRAALLAALLSEGRSAPRLREAGSRRARHRSRSDVLDLLHAFEADAGARRRAPRGAAAVLAARDQLLRLVGGRHDADAPDGDAADEA